MPQLRTRQHTAALRERAAGSVALLPRCKEKRLSDSVLVFVVEDEPLIHPLLHDALEEGGFTVELVSTAEEAMAAIETKADAFKALVTDVNLGSKLTGWDVARRAREIVPEIPVVYMSGQAESEWTANGVPKSIIISKPFVAAQLVTAVSQLLNGAPG